MNPEREEPASGPSAADPDRLFVMLYDELRRLAEHHVNRGGGALTLSPTTLLHDVYLRIGARRELEFPDRSHFFAYASRAMRALVIDYARRRRARRRGPEFEITLEGDEIASGGSDAESLARLSDALDELATASPRQAELVDMHFFCGFSLVEIAGMRGVSERTVQRDWRTARLILHQLLEEAASSTA